MYLYRYSGVTFILAVILLVTTRILQEKSGWFGLAERLLVWNMILWVEVSAVNLFAISLKRGDKNAACHLTAGISPIRFLDVPSWL